MVRKADQMVLVVLKLGMFRAAVLDVAARVEKRRRFCVLAMGCR